MEDNNEAPTRTWRSVLASVKIGRRFSSKKNVSVASSFSLDDSFLDGHVRIYALGKEHLSSKEQTLVFVDVPQISNNGTLANLNWKTLVQQSQVGPNY